jgi:hypothetical protein
LLKVDFHTHTIYSADSIASVSEQIAAARKRGLDRLAITDHNTLRGALEALSAAPEFIIPGEEVQTTEGELLALFVTREVPRGLEPMEALKRLKDQNAFISVSHPFDPARSGWKLATLEKLAPLVDAIETRNARMLRDEYNTLAEEFAAVHNLSGTAGSDGHHPAEVGRVYSLLPQFHNAESLRLAIRCAQNCGEISSPVVHFYSTWARIIKHSRKQRG